MSTRDIHAEAFVTSPLLKPRFDIFFLEVIASEVWRAVALLIQHEPGVGQQLAEAHLEIMPVGAYLHLREYSSNPPLPSS